MECVKGSDLAMNGSFSPTFPSWTSSMIPLAMNCLLTDAMFCLSISAHSC